MKRFSRCVLILILVAIISGAAGYAYENKTILPMYESTTQLYVVPGEENEASVRASNGGLKEDFTIIFKSNVVISAAQKLAGTSEDIAQYLTVTSPANSNIVEITCVNPDQNTAKKYVDAVASTAIKTTSIIPVKSIQILAEGTSSGEAFKPNLYRNTIIITGIASAICIFIEMIICLFLSAFKSKDEDFNHDYEYERRFGQLEYIEHKPQLIEADDKNAEKKSSKKKHKKNSDKNEALNFDDIELNEDSEKNDNLENVFAQIEKSEINSKEKAAKKEAESKNADESENVSSDKEEVAEDVEVKTPEVKPGYTGGYSKASVEIKSTNVASMESGSGANEKVQPESTFANKETEEETESYVDTLTGEEGYIYSYSKPVKSTVSDNNLDKAEEKAAKNHPSYDELYERVKPADSASMEYADTYSNVEKESTSQGSSSTENVEYANTHLNKEEVAAQNETAGETNVDNNSNKTEEKSAENSSPYEKLYERVRPESAASTAGDVASTTNPEYVDTYSNVTEESEKASTTADATNAEYANTHSNITEESEKASTAVEATNTTSAEYSDTDSDISEESVTESTFAKENAESEEETFAKDVTESTESLADTLSEEELAYINNYTGANTDTSVEKESKSEADSEKNIDESDDILAKIEKEESEDILAKIEKEESEDILAKIEKEESEDILAKLEKEETATLANGEAVDKTANSEQTVEDRENAVVKEAAAAIDTSYAEGNNAEIADILEETEKTFASNIAGMQDVTEKKFRILGTIRK